MSDQTPVLPQDIPNQWWSVPTQELIETFGIDASQGLNEDKVTESRDRFGSNRMQKRGPTSLWTLLWESVKSPMMLVLLSIAAISLALGQTREAIVMVVVVAIYVGVHLLNKARSDRTMAKLREVQAPKTIVLRGGEQREIDFQDVVVGDILPLRPGSRVPADARLLDSAGLLVDEAALTGESAPVHKNSDGEISPDTPLAERETAVFAGTAVLDGQGRALVTAVGDRTALGRVAELAAQPETGRTPLQKEMDDLATTLAYVAVGVSLLIPLVGLLRGFDFEQMVLTWLSLTFLMVPGQPPIIIAMALALAALELSRKQVIVRRLEGAETLGSVNTVLSDKTGTMTENEMQLLDILLPDGRLVPVDHHGDQEAQILHKFLQSAVLAIPETTNDPTDLAIKDAVEEYVNFDLTQPGELVGLIGFSRGGKFRSLTYQDGEGVQQFVTGRPAFLLAHSDRKMLLQADGVQGQPWDEGEKRNLEGKIAELAGQGKRIAAYAFHQGSFDAEEPEDLIFVGIAVISDPIRPEVPGAIQALSKAGVRTVMITGDIKETAAYVAEEVGLDASAVVMGSELEKMSDQELEATSKNHNVFARTTPEQKFDLVKALQRQGQVVAVTGDGINDAPALNAAHIGVSMGEKGSDVAREAADLILTDDNFAHLPDGVAIGRKAYDNFRKGITYYLSAKAILLTIFVVPLLFGIPFPLSPIQIIFTELLMDLASSTIFITESAEPDVMVRDPRKRRRFLSWDVGKRILRNMAGLTLVILAVYFGSLNLGFDVDSARTAAFSTWLLGHIVLALNLKQEKIPLIKQGLFSNKFAVSWLAGMILLVLLMTQWPQARSVLGTTGLSALQWGMVVGGALTASMWMEVVKWLQFRQNQ